MRPVEQPLLAFPKRFTALDAMTNPAPAPFHNEAEQRFEVREGELVAVMDYAPVDGRVAFTHTFVPDAWRGRGIAAILVQAALDEARRRGWRVIPQCSYVAVFISRHPEYADLAVS